MIDIFVSLVTSPFITSFFSVVFFLLIIAFLLSIFLGIPWYLIALLSEVLLNNNSRDKLQMFLFRAREEFDIGNNAVLFICLVLYVYNVTASYVDIPTLIEILRREF
tara:strand:+ start:104 stop:424 length:321 start_codon:yes stop_codon:yes gene_type:complete